MSGEVGSGDSTVLGLSWLYDEPVILGERVAARCSIVPQLTVLGLLDVLGYISNAIGLLYIHRLHVDALRPQAIASKKYGRPPPPKKMRQ